MPYLTRREAIMSGENITPMTREEAILQNQEGLKVFTKEEQLRLNNYPLTPPQAFANDPIQAQT